MKKVKTYKLKFYTGQGGWMSTESIDEPDLEKVLKQYKKINVSPLRYFRHSTVMIHADNNTTVVDLRKVAFIEFTVNMEV